MMIDNKAGSVLNRCVLRVVFFHLFVLSAAVTEGAVWWDKGWPYRIKSEVTGSGIVSATIDFTDEFSDLGLNSALLDIRSIRVIPYYGSTPGEPIDYAETYSSILENADDPQIGWHSSGIYWIDNFGTAELDQTRFSEGTGSLKAVVQNLAGGYGYPGVELKIASEIL